MPSLCQNIKTSYEHLQKLTADFTAKYLAVKDGGDLEEVRQLYRELEAARETLFEYLPFFIVPDAKNPHHEALLAAGLDLTETQEQQEMTVDIRKEIRRQLAIYQGAKDDAGNPCLTEWVRDITENESLIYKAAAKDRAKIMERIKAGMIPVVMPGRSVQIQTWKTAVKHLKPTCSKYGNKRTIETTHIDSGVQALLINELGPSNCFAHIPDRPYLMWTEPTEQPHPETINKTPEEQQAYNTVLLSTHPNLYDLTDLIPTEYVALQAMFTSSIQKQINKRTGGKGALRIYPLDPETLTRFLSIEASSDGHTLYTRFDIGRRRAYFMLGDFKKHNGCGFRPASRT